MDNYNTCYRRKVAVLKSLDWDIVNFTIYIIMKHLQVEENPSTVLPLPQ